MDANTFQRTCVARESKPKSLTASNYEAGSLVTALEKIIELSVEVDKLKKRLFYDDRRPTNAIPFSHREEQLKHQTAIASRLTHAVLGSASEAGEFAEIVLRYLRTGKLDVVHALEEIGDQLWYPAIAADALGVDLESVMAINDVKLAARYGPAFSTEAASTRDLSAERAVLETGVEESTTSVVEQDHSDGEDEG